MIKTKKDLSFYLTEDRKNYNSKPTFKDWLFHTEKYYAWNFLTELRKIEFRINTCKGVYGKLLLYFKYIKFYRLMHKTQLYIYPNVCGPGLYIPHIGYMLISAQAEIGKNCVIRPGTLIVSNLGSSNTKLRKVVVGDNVEFSEGCKILCKKIGNNVTVAPNAVIMKNIPDNYIAYGNPAELFPKKIEQI